MTVKKTIKDYFKEILVDYDLSAEHKAFLNERVEALEKKSTTRKPTASQIKNKAVADELLEFFANNPTTLFAVSELMKKAPCFNTIPDLTSQYANHIVKVLKDKGAIIRSESKGKAYFQYNADYEVEG